ncbi:hypothetical protein [Actinomadura decatromicini]|uniref:Uncharacterized protein n=1 Tax=Actinomadura decatromicini TaxID=2604572 RepID=A0A5D3FN10_9ACTN|nr:hypothetical protein [Actinomadura decatromicini]TYK49382.1 hypothetical protein FXF68_16595 [Actinomadura decatromicini]
MKYLFIVVAALMSTIVALVAALLKRADGASVSATILFGGAAFGGTLVLVLSVLSLLGAFDPRAAEQKK